MTRSPDIPDEALARIAPAVEALESALRSLAKQLTPGDAPAVTFANVAERGE